MKNNTKPFVSVIMPVYNAERYIVAAIESILNQTYQNFEFIIVDDASKDNSVEIIKKYIKKFPNKIKLIELSRNLNRGGDSCANLALQHAKGDLIARMDADDIAHPERLEKQVKFLVNNPDYFLVGTNAYVIDAEGKTIGEKKEPTQYHDIYKSYFTFHPLIHPSTMYRRNYGTIPFKYKLKFSANNDYYTFFTLLCKGYKFANLEEKLLYYRIHGKNDTFVKIKQKFMNTLKIRLIMVTKYGYNITAKQLATTLVQSLILFMLPEKVITQLYLIAKGIVKIDIQSILKNNFIVNSLLVKNRVNVGQSL